MQLSILDGISSNLQLADARKLLFIKHKLCFVLFFKEALMRLSWIVAMLQAQVTGKDAVNIIQPAITFSHQNIQN